jgi:hypothetical protein
MSARPFQIDLEIARFVGSPSALRSADDFERLSCGTEWALRGRPQVVWHLLQKFESNMVFRGEFGDGIAER